MSINRALAFVVIALLPTTAYAEKGEFQFYLGGGVYFPFDLKAGDNSVIALATPLVAAEIGYGIIDDLDLSIKANWTYFANGVTKGYTPPGFIDPGDLWFDYTRWTLAGRLRWNFYPGYAVSPHLIAGGGVSFDNFSNRTWYTESTSQTFPDQSRTTWLAEGGIDVTWRVWWKLLLRLEVVYTYTPISNGISLLGSIGIDTFLNPVSVMK